MHMYKPIYMLLTAALLFGGCSQPEPGDETDNIQQKAGNLFVASNNMFIQACGAPVSPQGLAATVLGLKRWWVDSSGFETWQVVRDMAIYGGDIENSFVDLFFLPGGAIVNSKAVKGLSQDSATKGFFKVTYYNDSSRTTTTTNTMNTVNGDMLWINVKTLGLNGQQLTLYYLISLSSATSTAGLYKAQYATNPFGAADGDICPEWYVKSDGTLGTRQAWLMPFPGHKFDPKTKVHTAASGWISFGSTQDALGGCEQWGYGLWGPNADKFDGCTRAKRADLCGDGRLWTDLHAYIDVQVQVWDNAGYHPMGSHTPSDMEAWYTGAGATCVNVNKFRLTYYVAVKGLPYNGDGAGTFFDAATTCGHAIPTCTSSSTGKIGIGRVCSNGVCP